MIIFFCMRKISSRYRKHTFIAIIDSMFDVQLHLVISCFCRFNTAQVGVRTLRKYNTVYSVQLRVSENSYLPYLIQCPIVLETGRDHPLQVSLIAKRIAVSSSCAMGREGVVPVNRNPR
jgi:hypothetical protein